jgi:hypothetical protein
MTLRTLIAADAESVLMNTDDFAETVTISQKGQADLTLPAMLVQHDYEVFDTQGFPTMVPSWDWQIREASLAGRTLRSGNKITQASGRVFELMPIERRGVVERLDDIAGLLLVHTKLVQET